MLTVMFIIFIIFGALGILIALLSNQHKGFGLFISGVSVVTVCSLGLGIPGAWIVCGIIMAFMTFVKTITNFIRFLAALCGDDLLEFIASILSTLICLASCVLFIIGMCIK